MTRPPWEADHELDEAQFARVLERRFPEFQAPAVVPLEHGWDYLTFRVDEDWAFKVPKRAAVVSRMRQEVSLLTALPTMPASIPRPAFHGVAADDLPYPFFGYPYLEGVNARDADVSPDVLVPAVMDFLDALHAVTPPFAVEGWSTGTWATQLDALRHVRTLRPAFAPALHWLAHNEPIGRRKVLLHDDLGLEHLLLHPDSHALVAVLDWADASRGDPARDLVSLILWSPDATARIHRARGGDDATLVRAGAHALLTGLRILDDKLRWGADDRAAWEATMTRVQAGVLDAIGG
jgi:aminoglycoside phosphotransferase (APT) family kinase protein